MLIAKTDAAASDIPASIREQAAAIPRPFTGHRPVIGIMRGPHSRTAFWAIRLQLGDPRNELLDDFSLFRAVEAV